MLLPGFTRKTYAVDLILASGPLTRRHVTADSEAEALAKVAEMHEGSRPVGIGEWSSPDFGRTYHAV